MSTLTESFSLCTQNASYRASYHHNVLYTRNITISVPTCHCFINIRKGLELSTANRSPVTGYDWLWTISKPERARPFFLLRLISDLSARTGYWRLTPVVRRWASLRWRGLTRRCAVRRCQRRWWPQCPACCSSCALTDRKPAGGSKLTTTSSQVRGGGWASPKNHPTLEGGGVTGSGTPHTHTFRKPNFINIDQICQYICIWYYNAEIFCINHHNDFFFNFISS